jgi:hypothetical protein
MMLDPNKPKHVLTVRRRSYFECIVEAATQAEAEERYFDGECVEIGEQIIKLTFEDFQMADADALEAYEDAIAVGGQQ